jgi:hypothetical protein
VSVWRRLKDAYLGGDPDDANWVQDVSVVGRFPLPGDRGRMQRHRRRAREMVNIAAGVPGPVVSGEDQAVTADMLVPGWLARELPPGSLVAYEKDRYAASCGRFRQYDGTWIPVIESDHGVYRILYLAESATPVR